MRPALILLLSICFFFINCKQLPTSYALQHSWKHGKGFRVGDWIEFDHDLYELRHDTIYKNKVPVARIKAINKGIVAGDDNEMVIQSLIGFSTGVYHEK